MKKLVLLSACCAFASTTAFAHIHIEENSAPAGYDHHPMKLSVPHGCGDSPVKEVHMKIPDGITAVRIGYNRDWKIQVKNRKLDKPVPGEGGRTITETIDEIIWSEPKSPIPAAGFYDSFPFEATLPNKPGEILFFKAYAVCEKGDDKYVEVPKTPINANDPDFGKKMAQFIRSGGPAPWVVLVKPDHPQFPWGSLSEVGKAAGK